MPSISKFPWTFFGGVKAILILYPWTWNSITCNAKVYRPVGECQLSIHRCSKNTDKSPWLPPHDSGSSKSSIYNFQCHQEYCFFLKYKFVAFFETYFWNILRLDYEITKPERFFFSRHWSFFKINFWSWKKRYAKFVNWDCLLITYLSFKKQTTNFETKLVFRFCEKKTLLKENTNSTSKNAVSLVAWRVNLRKNYSSLLFVYS